jgi:putative phosphoesterase
VGGKQSSFTVGLVSDTHDLLRPEALAAIGPCSLLIHAGDIASPWLLDHLRSQCPTIAVRGNADKGTWADRLPRFEVVDIGGVFIYIRHDLNEMDLDPACAGFQVVLTGHTHVPSISSNGGVLFVNPGSAGPRRAGLPAPSVGRLVIADGIVTPELIALSETARGEVLESPHEP